MMGASMLEVLGTLLSITALSKKSRSTKWRGIIFARPHLLALLTIIISFLCFFCGTRTSWPAGSSADRFMGAILKPGLFISEKDPVILLIGICFDWFGGVE